MKRIAVFTGLIKYKLSLAVTFSAVTGFLISGSISWNLFLFLVPGVFLLSSGAAALNQYTEHHFDAKMDRTKYRPIPQLQISQKSALEISVLLLFSGTVILFAAGIVPALLGLTTVFIYNLVYTRLKRVTPFSLLPGAFVGAIPPVIGYTASGISILNNEILIFAAFMFLWQIPHFLLIMINFRDEYMKAGFKAISAFLNDRQIKILAGAVVLLTTSALLILSVSGVVFQGIFHLLIFACSLIFISVFYILLFNPGKSSQVHAAFISVNAYSLAIMILFILDRFF